MSSLSCRYHTTIIPLAYHRPIRAQVSQPLEERFGPGRALASPSTVASMQSREAGPNSRRWRAERGRCSQFGAIRATRTPMKYVSIRELRNRPGRVWSTLSKGDVVLTASGKPMAVLMGVDETRLDDTVEAIRRAKAILAVSRMREKA